MKYRVIITDDALADTHRFLTYIAVEKQAPETARRWWIKAVKAIDTLDFMPHRCPYAQENNFSKKTIRALRVDSCLFLYRVDEESKAVRILRMRHGRQMPYDLE